MDIINTIISSIIVVSTPLIFTKLILKCKIRSNRKKAIVSVFVAIILYILTYKFSSDIYKSILTFCISTFSISNFYKLELKDSLILSVILIIILIIPELMILLMSLLFNLSREYLYETFSGNLISNLLAFIVMIVLTKILRKKIITIINVKIRINTKIIIFSILILISVLAFFYDVIESFRVNSKTIFYIVAMVTFIIALITVIKQENKNNKLKIEYNKLLEFMETYEVELEQQRILKHEYKNQLITIKSKLIDNDKKNKVIGYIDNILGDNKKFNQEEYTKLQYLPANGIKALFYFKISEAKNKEINVSVNISSSVKNSILNNLTTKEFKDLGILIGVYLDNAIEASLQSEKKLLGIEMYNTEEGIIMIISNSYNGTIEETKIGRIPFSTKGKGRGYGLMLVSSTLRNNKKFRSEKEVTNSLYVQTIIIKK